MPLAACQTSQNLGSFVPGDRPAGTPTRLPTVCRAFLQPVEKSKVTPHTDARAAYTRRDAEVDEVNARIAAGGACVDDENAVYLGANGAGPARALGSKPPAKLLAKKGGRHGPR